MASKFDIDKKKNEPKKVSRKRRPTPWEQKNIELNDVLELMSRDIQTLYMNMENLMMYATVIANVNAALAKILISKKITTEAAIKKQYVKIVKEMEQQEKQIKEQMKKFIPHNVNPEDFDFSGIDTKNMKVN